ncbi:MULTISPECIES: MBL fold metallo-hydrolase [unclassified Thioalkalivibrio]|uniref:MBL fold metallo-hydrolase n=1 Tax=unclassified Thioalkalivibrio TaxID=2621013 RepID=UPI000382F27F|nr:MULTISPECIES: MBL fold metallo-hydrolase [unclassified Thioalkalivibrio]
MPQSSALPYRIHRQELGPMENFVYLIEDMGSRRAAVVDPAWDPDAILRQAREQDVEISDILLTHSHHDHINGIEAILEYNPSARLHLLKPEAEFWGRDLEQPQLHHGGDRFMLGDTEIRLLHTPGHTPGSTCFHMPAGDDLITGDTLFVFGCGRCDLHGGDPEQMFHTLKGLREGLPEHTCIHPGHNYAEKPESTLAEEEEGNPFMHFEAVDDFVHYRMHEHDRVRSQPYHPVPRKR